MDEVHYSINNVFFWWLLFKPIFIVILTLLAIKQHWNSCASELLKWLYLRNTIIIEQYKFYLTYLPFPLKGIPTKIAVYYKPSEFLFSVPWIRIYNHIYFYSNRSWKILCWFSLITTLWTHNWLKNNLHCLAMFSRCTCNLYVRIQNGWNLTGKHR